MNKANPKAYPPQARKDWHAAVIARASLLGI